VVFAVGALLMAWDFIIKLRPIFPNLLGEPGSVAPGGTSAPIAPGQND
jgi:hypothetical protein